MQTSLHHNLNLRDGGWGAGKVLILQIEDNCGEDPGSEVDYGHHCNVNKKRVNEDDAPIFHIRYSTCAEHRGVCGVISRPEDTDGDRLKEQAEKIEENSNHQRLLVLRLKIDKEQGALEYQVDKRISLQNKNLIKLLNVVHLTNPWCPGHLSKGSENDVEGPGNLEFCDFYRSGHGNLVTD